MCDVVVDVSGNPNAILKSVDCLHRQSTMVLGGLTGDSTVTPMLMDKLVWNEIKLQGCFTADNDATEAALRLIEETKFPVQEMVSHTFPLKDIEKCIRAVGGEIPEMFPTKALINPASG
jgi:threonine dehydrogenase-like Zn-dependent dehydrogenase